MELQKKESTDLPLLKKQLAETEKGINNMLNAIQAGIFTPSTKQRLDELEETKSQLEVSILQEEMHKPLLTREQIAFFIYRFRKFDVTKREQRQRLIDSFVNAVYLYEDKIILTFKYKDGSKTITLAEVEGSDLSVLGALHPWQGKVSKLAYLRHFWDFFFYRQAYRLTDADTFWSPGFIVSIISSRRGVYVLLKKQMIYCMM